MKKKVLILLLFSSLFLTACQSKNDVLLYQLLLKDNETEKTDTAEETIYTFTAEETDDNMPYGSKICNIIEGFPKDYNEREALVYGKLKHLFGEPLYETEDLEDQYSYIVCAESKEGGTCYLYVYSGATGSAIGGLQDEESQRAAAGLSEYILQAEADDYEYTGYYYDGLTMIHMGVKNGVPFWEEEEFVP